MKPKQGKPNLPRSTLTYDQKLDIARWILEEKDVLFGALSGTVTNILKASTWDNILQKARSKEYPIHDVSQIRQVCLYEQLWIN